MKNKLLIIITLLIYSCTSSHEEKNTIKNNIGDSKKLNQPIHTTTDNKNDDSILSSDSLIERKNYKKVVEIKYKDFEDFYLQFIKDSTFQLSRVRFPIKGQYQDYDDQHNWTKSNWPNMTWDVRDTNNQEDSTSVIQTKDRFFFGTYCLDCGFSFEMEFNKLSGKWFLTYRQENNF